jgi:hypothetical protein
LDQVDRLIEAGKIKEAALIMGELVADTMRLIELAEEKKYH